MSNSRTSKVLALSLGRILVAVIGLLTSVVLARMLSLSDLATYRQTFLAYNIAAPFLSLGLSSGIYYFLPSEKERAKKIVIEGLLVMLAMGIFYSIFISFGGNKVLSQRFSNPDIEKTLLYLIPYPIITLPAGLISAVLVVRGKIKQLNLFNLFSNLFLGLSVVLVCTIWTEPSALVITNVSLAIISGFFAIYLMLKSVPGGEWSPQWKTIKKTITFSLPLALASMMGSMALQFDKLIVTLMRTPEEFAIYSVGATEIPIVTIITGAISTVILVDMASYCKKGDKNKALDLFKKGALRSSMVIIPIMVFLMWYAEDFIIMLFSDKFRDSVGVFRIYLGMLPVRIVVYGSALIALNMTRFVLYRSVFDLLLNILFSVLFVYLFGIYGAALGTAVMLYLWHVPFNTRMISRGFDCRWSEVLPYGEILKIAFYALCAVVISGLVTSVLNFKEEILTVGVGATVFSFIYICTCVIFVKESKSVASTLFYRFKREC